MDPRADSAARIDCQSGGESACVFLEEFDPEQFGSMKGRGRDRELLFRLETNSPRTGSAAAPI
jgi:hypothetical protein